MRTLELRDIAVRFGTVEVLEGLNLSLEAGRVTLLAGPNGAGKSTLIRILLGLVRPDRGQVVRDGVVVQVDRAFKSKLGYLPESVAFSESLTGREVLAFFAQARGAARSAVAATLDRVGLADAGSRLVRDYSRGMRQRLGLGVAILSEPELLVLDEPSGGLDQDGLMVLWSVLEEWKRKDRVVLLASHEIALLESRIDDVCLLARGVGVARGAPLALRRRADLDLQIHLTLAAACLPETQAFLEGLNETHPHRVESHGSELELSLSPSALLPLFALQARHPGSVLDLRVKEPPFDEVYRRLLDTALAAPAVTPDAPPNPGTP